MATDDHTAAARFDRLIGICRRIRWTEHQRPALDDGQTEAAIEDLFLFLADDAFARGVERYARMRAREWPGA